MSSPRGSGRAARHHVDLDFDQDQEDDPGATVCPYCSMAYKGARNRCGRCGTLMGEAVRDIQGAGVSARRLLRSRKALSDTLFLVGLLLGGPIITIAHNVVIGGFIVLAGGLASALRRYTDWSLPGTLLVATLSAMAVAAWVIEPARSAIETSEAGEGARLAYAQALAGQDEASVQARGANHIAIWFGRSEAQVEECGTYPDAEVRAHLAELGFLRVVVERPNQSGGICSFKP